MPRLSLNSSRSCPIETPPWGRFSFGLAALGSLALLGSWLAPNHYLPWTSFHGEGAAFVALIAFCGAALAQPYAPVMRTTVPLVIFGLMVGVALQWRFGLLSYGGDALVSSLYLTGLALAWSLGHASGSSERTIKRDLTLLAGLFVLGAALSVGLGVLQSIDP